MKVVRDRPEALRLPSRRRFALWRLIAFLAPARTDAPRRMAVAIERDQSAAEAYVTCCWYVATLACYIAALLPPAAWIAAIPLAIVVIHLVCTIVTLPLPDQDNTSASSAGLFALLTIASSIFATQPSWARFVARLFFVVLIANAAAAVVMWLLRERVAALEARCGA